MGSQGQNCKLVSIVEKILLKLVNYRHVSLNDTIYTPASLQTHNKALHYLMTTALPSLSDKNVLATL